MFGSGCPSYRCCWGLVFARETKLTEADAEEGASAFCPDGPDGLAPLAPTSWSFYPRRTEPLLLCRLPISLLPGNFGRRFHWNNNVMCVGWSGRWVGNKTRGLVTSGQCHQESINLTA